MKKFIQVVVVVVTLILAVYAVMTYWDEFRLKYFAPDDDVLIYIGDTPFSVSVADTPQTRQKGLSGGAPLGQFEGKLFIFDKAAKHGIWMKDMTFDIDILWFDEEFTLVHFESSVSPDSYPRIFAPDTEARYVVELHADTIRSLRIQEGDRLILPASLLPAS